MAISLTAARINARLEQWRVCERLKISRQTLSKWENGRAYPDAMQFKQLCEMYGCAMEDISLPEKS